MDFIVTYRSANGALREECVDAAERADCFAKCKRLGIVPVSVREGKIGKSAASSMSRRHEGYTPEKRSHLTGKAAILAVAVLAVAGGAWWWLAGARDVRRDVPKRVVPAPRPKPAKARVAPAPAPVVTNTTSKQSAARLKTTNEVWNGHEIASTQVATSGVNVITTRVGVDGKIYKQIEKLNDKPIFDNPVDQVLALMLTTPKGGMIPPMPPLGAESDDMFIKGLKRPIEILEDDSPEVRNVKRIVMAAREEMLEELAAGHSVNQVIAKHCTTVNENAKLRAQAIAEYRRILDEDGDEAMAEKYREKANTLLANVGAVPIAKRGESSRPRKSQNERNQ